MDNRFFSPTYLDILISRIIFRFILLPVSIHPERLMHKNAGNEIFVQPVLQS